MSYTQFWRRVGAEEDEEDAILLPRPAVKLSMDLPTMPLPQPRSSTPPVVVAPTTSTRSGFKFKKTLTAASTPASPSTTTSPSTPASPSTQAPASASTLAAASSPAAASTPAPASPPAAACSPAPASTPASSKSQTPKPSSRYLSFRILNHRASISISSSGLDPAPQI